MLHRTDSVSMAEEVNIVGNLFVLAHWRFLYRILF
jgi:hypothetical protein